MVSFSRRIIDNIDKRLGSVDNEIKFDVTVICVSVVAIITGFILTAFFEDKKAPVIIGIILLLIGVDVLYVMIKELIADLKKAKKNNL